MPGVGGVVSYTKPSETTHVAAPSTLAAHTRARYRPAAGSGAESAARNGALAPMLRQAAALTELDLYGNELGAEGCRLLEPVLRHGAVRDAGLRLRPPPRAPAERERARQTRPADRRRGHPAATAEAAT